MSDLPAVLATRENIVQQAKRYGATVHGDTATDIDLEFPDLYSAASLHHTFPHWEMRMVDPVDDFTTSVVVTVEIVSDHITGDQAMDAETTGKVVFLKDDNLTEATVIEVMLGHAGKFLMKVRFTNGETDWKEPTEVIPSEDLVNCAARHNR